MGYAELIDLLEKLPPERQAEVVDFAEFLAGRSAVADAGDADRRQRILAALHAARAAFPAHDPERLRKEFADMRNEWSGRGWEAMP